VGITRKAFLVQLVGGGWVLAGCGGGGGYGGGSAAAPAPSTGAGCSATITGNHGHTLTIPVADLNSTVDMTYDIMGAADHAHSVTFSAMDLYNLKFGYTVAVTSTMSVASAMTPTPAHSHAIGEHCA
jgi:hypothetical protein